MQPPRQCNERLVCNYVACSPMHPKEKEMKVIADYEHPLVRETAVKLTEGRASQEEKLEAIFYYVRDEIQFGFLKRIDDYSASEIIEHAMGQCNNKSALFLALCKAVGIKSRIHYSGITKNIQRGLFTGIPYKLMPREISHSWVEVFLEERWISLDSFINDLDFYRGGKKELVNRKWKTGFSVSCEKGDSSAEFNLDNRSFVQMGAITGDHGIYDDPGEYYQSAFYNNRISWVKKLVYRSSLKGINGRVEKLRRTAGKRD